MARRPERIDIIFNNIISRFPILLKWLGDDSPEGQNVGKNIQRNSWRLYKYWTEHYDQRLGQMLFNTGFTDDKMYHEEATSWLVSEKVCRPQEVKFWGTFGLSDEERRDTIKNLNSKCPDYRDYTVIEPREESYMTFYRDRRDWVAEYNQRLNRTYKPISELDTDHIKAILDGKHYSSESYKQLFEDELVFRRSTPEKTT